MAATPADTDRAFAGSIPELYERYLVPLIFEPYAVDIATRVARRAPASVLEIAAGTGVVTRRLAAMLPASVEIVATDLNQAMLDQAASVGTCRPVVWRTADAGRLPFPDRTFDVAVCQFGAMFFLDQRQAYAEARRVLRPGGAFIFNVWDAIEHNAFAHVVTQIMASVFPQDPPRFLARLPHGYHDTALIAGQLAEAGFDRTPGVHTLEVTSRAASPAVVAIAYCQGTPLRNEIEARDASRLIAATEAAAVAIGDRFGPAQVTGKIQAHVFVAER